MKKLLKWLPFICTVVIGILCPSLIFGKSVGNMHYLMPFSAIGTYACQRIQTKLVDYYGKNVPQYRTGGSIGFLRWLLSPQNTAGFQKINVESIPGKKRGVAFLVKDPYCYTLCALTVACNADNIQYVDPQSRELVFDLTNDPWRHCDNEGRPVKLRFKEEDLMKYCTIEDSTYMTDEISRYLLRFEEALSGRLTGVLNTQIGNNALDQSITNIPIFTAANIYTPHMSTLNPEARWYIDQVYRLMGFENQYSLIGGEIVSKVATMQKWATGNDAGIDLSKADPQNPYMFYDKNFNTTFGQSDMIMLAPGATQLVTWNRYKGEKNRQVTNLYSNGTVVLPRTGLEVDWKWRFDYNCDEWTFEAFLYGEMAAAVKGACAGSNLENVNGIVRIHDCGTQPIVPACPPSVSS